MMTRRTFVTALGVTRTVLTDGAIGVEIDHVDGAGDARKVADVAALEVIAEQALAVEVSAEARQAARAGGRR